MATVPSGVERRGASDNDTIVIRIQRLTCKRPTGGHLDARTPRNRLSPSLPGGSTRQADAWTGSPSPLKQSQTPSERRERNHHRPVRRPNSTGATRPTTCPCNRLDTTRRDTSAVTLETACTTPRPHLDLTGDERLEGPARRRTFSNRATHPIPANTSTHHSQTALIASRATTDTLRLSIWNPVRPPPRTFDRDSANQTLERTRTERYTVSIFELEGPSPTWLFVRSSR